MNKNAYTGKLKESIAKLKHALGFEKKIHDDEFYFLGIVKAFETCFEYSWKHFKREATKQGLEAYSPRESIKAAGQLGLIDDVKTWLAFLENRNYAVHDYCGLSTDDYMETIKEFYKEACRLKI